MASNNNRVSGETDRIVASEIDKFFSESEDTSKRALRKEAKAKKKAAKAKNKKSPFVIEMVEKTDDFEGLGDLLDMDDEAIEAEDEAIEVEDEAIEVDDVAAGVEDENVVEDAEESEESEEIAAIQKPEESEEAEASTKAEEIPTEDYMEGVEEVSDVDPMEEKRRQKRIARQKRRRKNRIIAFVALIGFLVVVCGGAFFGISFAINKHNERVEAEEIVEAAIEAALEEEEPIIEIDMTPDVVEEEEEPVEEIIEQSDEELLDEMVRTMIADMTLEDKVAGLFILSPEILTGQGNVTKAGEGTQSALEKYPIGGLVYTKQNIKSADQLKEMIENSISYNKYPMFIGISENGGSDSQLSALKVEKTASAKELGAESNSAAVFDAYNSIGINLRENGFNYTFGLSADVMTNGVNDSFGDDAVNVAAMVGGAIGGLKEAGIYTCVKFFPGMGHVEGDPKQVLTSTTRTKAEMELEELLPYVAAIEAGVDMIMVGHFAVPDITGDNMPCSMSKAVMTDLLRTDMGYDGIIITDACNAESISQYYGADEIAIKSLKAGADMIFMPEDFELAFQGVVEAVQDGTIDERRIDDSLARVYKVKYKNALSN